MTSAGEKNKARKDDRGEAREEVTFLNIVVREDITAKVKLKDFRMSTSYVDAWENSAKSSKTKAHLECSRTAKDPLWLEQEE